jgi:hypothetical protein
VLRGWLASKRRKLGGELGEELIGKRREPRELGGVYRPIRRLYKCTRGVYGPARE